jgi:uncharacterized membrane protein YcaP (DUF421 family)
MLIDIALQSLYALLYYAGLVLVVRFAGKRLGGQITTFDMVVLIQLAVVLQTTAFQEGFANGPLVRNGKVSAEALDEEGLSYEELLAGLRKQGHESPSDVKLAVLEETGQISVIEKN